MIVFLVGFRLILFVHDLLNDDFRIITEVPFEIAVIAAAAAISGLIYFIVRQARRSSMAWQLLVAALLAASGSAILGLTLKGACEAFMEICPTLDPSFVVIHVLAFFPPFAMWAAMSLTIAYYTEVRERERRMAVAQAEAQDAQLRALHYEINPQLLYNSLNSIAALIADRKNSAAEDMVVRLSDFFRASLSRDLRPEGPLGEEIAVSRLYLEIEQMRFPDRLSATIEIPVELEGMLVPSAILQPLIEDILSQAGNPDGGQVRILLRAREQARRLVVEVCGDGVVKSGLTAAQMGLDRILDRLRSTFGHNADVNAELISGSGLVVRLCMPAVAHP